MSPWVHEVLLFCLNRGSRGGFLGSSSIRPTPSCCASCFLPRRARPREKGVQSRLHLVCQAVAHAAGFTGGSALSVLQEAGSGPGLHARNPIP